MDEIIKEVIDACMNMGEPERTEYLIKNFEIKRKGKVVTKKLFRDPQIPNAYTEYNIE